MSLKEFYQDFNSQGLILKKCKEKCCELINASKDYYILDGDKIESINSSGDSDKSADCILVSKKLFNGKCNVIICELGTNKRFKDVKEKLINSANYICNVLKKYGLEINKFTLLYLGSLKNNSAKNMAKKLKGRVLHICYHKKVKFENKGTKFNIDDLKVEIS